MRQKQALSVLMSGANVFLTGAPGAGKTYVLNKFVKHALRAGKSVAVTASTGIAATHIGGTTIHSWSGLGIRDSLGPTDLQWLGSNSRLIKRYNNTDILVIDEVSMLHGQRLDMVNTACKLLRQNEAPFGGLQVILVGDLYQLPPVSRGSKLLDFVHTSNAWAELDLSICYLNEQHRQIESDGLLELLSAMRSGQLEELHETMLHDRLEQPAPDSSVITRLFAHNVDVDTINNRQLATLDTHSRFFLMETKGRQSKVEQLTKSVLAPEELELKIGAEVMFVANNFADGFANGSRGQVIGFKDNLPLVQLASGRILRVEPNTWSLTEDEKVRAEVIQLPLRLAWAITIHKSQGMSLDAAEVDLSRAFTPGMGYVALSRVRSLPGLYLRGVNSMALAMHPQIRDFDGRLRQASMKLADITPDHVAASNRDDSEKPSQIIDQALLAKLKDWRLKRATADHIPAYIVAHNTTLEAVAARPSTSLQQLLALPGFGKHKVESYGADLLALIAAHTATLPPKR